MAVVGATEKGVGHLRRLYLEYTETSKDVPRLSWKDWLDSQGYDLTGLDVARLMIPPKAAVKSKKDGG